MEDNDITVNQCINEVTQPTKLPLINSKFTASEVTYMDLYMTVTESPYKVNKFVEGHRIDNNTIDVTNETPTIDSTVNYSANDVTLFLPVKAIDPTREVDPLSVTTLCTYDSPSKMYTHDDCEKLSSCQSLNMDDNTIFIPCSTSQPPRELSGFGIDPLSIETECLVESQSGMNVEEDSKKQSMLNSSGLIERNMNESLSLTLKEAEISSINELKGLSENDSNYLGSLLMLSTELNDSISSSKDLFSSSASSLKDASVVVSELQYKLHDYSKNITKREFDSSGNKDSFFMNEPENINDFDANIVLLQKHLNNTGCDGSLLHNDLNENGNLCLNLSIYEKLLPSMKTQLNQLLLYIKVVSNSNLKLEEEAFLSKVIIDKMKEEKNKITDHNMQINEEKSLLKAELDKIMNENGIIKEEMLSFKKMFLSSRDEQEGIKKELSLSYDEISQLNDKLKEYYKFEEEICNIIRDVHKLKMRNENCLTIQSDLEKINCGNIITILKEEVDFLKNNFKSTCFDLDDCENKLNLAEAKNVILNKQLEELQRKFELEVCSLKTDISKLKEKEHEVYTQNCQILQEKSLLETDYGKVTNENIMIKDQLGSVENKLQCIIQKEEELKSKLKYSQEQVVLLTEQVEESKSLLESEKLHQAMSTEQFDIKHNLVNSQYEALKESHHNLETKFKLLLEEKEDQESLLKKENDNLKEEMLKNKNVFSEFLNLKTDYSYNDILSEFQKRLYKLTVIEEKLAKEEQNSKVTKSENNDLKDQIKAISVYVKKLENDLGLSNFLHNEEKEIIAKLNEKYDKLEKKYQDNLIVISQVESDFKEFKQLCDNFMSILQHYFTSPSSSKFDDVLKSFTIFFEKLFAISETYDETSQMRSFFNDLTLFCSETYKIFLENLEFNIIVNNSIRDLINDTGKDIKGIEDKVDELFKQCSSTKMENNRLFNVSPNENKSKLLYKNSLINYFNVNFELVKNSLVLTKKQIKAESNSCKSFTNEQFSSKNDDLFRSDLVIKKDVPASCHFCKDKEQKLKDNILLLSAKDCEISSQQLEIDNLKSRYYEKYNSLGIARDKISVLKEKLTAVEKENIILKKKVEVEKEAIVTLETAVQCEEVKQSAPPPSNFVQLCKIKELNRKFEKLLMKYKSLKEDNLKKDEKIYSLSEILNKFSCNTSLDDKRSVLGDKTNSNMT